MIRGLARKIGLVFVAALAATGCGARKDEPAAPAGPTIDVALPIAREAAGAAVDKRFSAFTSDDLSALEALGLVQFDDKRRNLGQPVFEIQLTEDGKSLGLEVDWPSPDWPWGPSGVKTKKEAEPLCRLEFGKVSAIESRPGGPLPAAEVKFVRQHVAQSKLHARLKQSTRPLGDYCDATVIEPGRVLIVERPVGWRANRPPAWEGDWKAETSYEYNRDGQLTGAVTKIALTGGIVDPDGDAVVEGAWAARRPAVKERDGDGRARTLELVDAPLVVEPSSVTFRPEIWDGRPAGGELRLEARDPWETGGLTICLEGSGWSC